MLNADLYIRNTPMNLITQFPDISMKIREQARMKRSCKKTISTNRIERTRSQIYEREFRSWHLKLFFMMILLLASIYLIMLNAPWMFDLINAIMVNVKRASL